MARLSFILPALLSSLCLSCTVRAPRGIPSESEMERLLYDYHLAQSAAGSEDSADYKLRLYTDAVLAKHGMSRNDFDSAMRWYSRHADKLYEVYGSLSRRLSNEAQALGAAPGLSASGRYAGLAPAGDTANIWRGPSGGLLLPYAGCNVFSFQIDNDSVFKPSDKYEWHFNTKFVYQSGRKSAVAALAVRYENDSVTSVQRQIYSDSENMLSLTAADLPVRRIEGFVYLEEELGAEARMLFLSKFVLARFRSQIRRDTASAPADSAAAEARAAEKAGPEPADTVTAGGVKANRQRAMPRRKAKTRVPPQR